MADEAATLRKLPRVKIGEGGELYLETQMVARYWEPPIFELPAAFPKGHQGV
jgi:hypothetical protein